MLHKFYRKIYFKDWDELGDYRLRLAYTITCSILQYFLPCIFVIFAYSR